MRYAAVLGTLIVLSAVAAWWGLRGDPGSESAPGEIPQRGTGIPDAAATPTLGSAPLEGRRPSSGDGAADPARPGDSPATGRSRVTGRVVDEARQPVAGAEILLLFAEERVSAASDEEGRFAVETSLPPGDGHLSGRVEARWGSLVVHRPLWLRAAPGRGSAVPSAQDLGDLVLGPSAALVVEVERRCGGAGAITVHVYDANFPIEPAVARTESGPEGRLAVEALPVGRYRVIASAHGCGRATAVTPVPRPDGTPLQLLLGDERVLSVLVVDRTTEAGIPGARVRVLDIYREGDAIHLGPAGSLPSEIRTDEQGRAALTGLGAEDQLDLEASAEGYPPAFGMGGMAREAPWRVRTAPGATEARLLLEKARTIRWPLKPGAVGPADGAVVRLTPFTNSGLLRVPPEGRMEGRDLVVEGWGPGHAAAYAHAPDGSIARLGAAPDKAEGYPIEFFSRRTITVTLRGENGEPLAGWTIQPIDQGNNPVVAGVATDEHGVARIEDLYGGPGSLVDVHASPTEGAPRWSTFAVGTVNLAQQDGTLEVTIPAERGVVLRVTAEGRSFLPPSHTLIRLNGLPATPETRDEATGELRFRWRPAPSARALTVAVTAAGFLPATSKPVAIGRADEVLAATVDLRRGGSLRVPVTLPSDGRHEVVLERFDEKAGAWPSGNLANRYNFVPGRTAENGAITFGDLAVGRYRAIDAYSGIVSTEATVVSGGEPAEASLDLSASGWVRGRVLAPSGEPAPSVGVGFEGEPPRAMEGALFPGTSQAVTSTNQQGEFTIRVPGDRPVNLRGFHTTWMPASEGGVVAVTAPRDGVVLRMAQGWTATLAFSSPARLFMNPGQEHLVPVFLYAGDPDGPPAARLVGRLSADARTVQFGGFPPGTWTIWMDVQHAPHLPVVLRGVTLGAADVDLGVLPLEEGGRFTLEVLVKPGESPPRYSVWVTRLGEPTYTRSADASSKAITVSGLGPGRYRVTASSYSGRGAYLHEEFDMDGRTEVRRTIELTK